MNVKIRNLAFSYGKNRVLTDVNFDAHPGQLVAILGKNGCGKTTLLKNINRLLKPSGGSITIGDQDVSSITRREMARLAAYMPQAQAAVHCTVFEAVLLGKRARRDNSTSKAVHRKVAEILARVGIEDLAMRPTNALSSGELQKVVLGRALAQDPRVMLLDEPINYLDPVNQLEVMSLLRGETRSLSMVSFLVTHDLNQALRFADRFLMLRDGKVFAAGGREVVNPDSIRAVYDIKAVVEQVNGIPVVVPEL